MPKLFSISSVICYLIAIGIGIFFLIIPSFGTWYALWGVGGILFALFLFPVAIIAFPVMLWMGGAESGLMAFTRYLDMASVIFLMWLGSYLSEKADRLLPYPR